MKTATITTTIAALALSACASAPGAVAPTYVPPAQYAGLACEDLTAQLATTGQRRARLAEDQETARTRDQIVMGVGLLLFTPALLVLAAPDSDEELAQAKGEEAAIRDAIAASDCGKAPEAGA